LTFSAPVNVRTCQKFPLVCRKIATSCLLISSPTMQLDSRPFYVSSLWFSSAGIQYSMQNVVQI